MRVKLGDVCDRGSSNLMQKEIVNKSGQYPIYGASGQIGSVDFFHQDSPYVAVVKDGAGIGRTMLLPAKSSIIGTLQYLLPRPNVLPDYLCYVVQYMHLEKYFSGATIPHIYFRDYKNEEFNLVSIEEQKAIVEILNKLQGIIKKRHQQLRKLDELVKARFIEMFGDEARMDRWPCCRIGDVAEVSVGVVIKPAQYYTDDSDNGIPAFRSLNIGEMYIKDNNWVYFTSEGNAKNKKSILRENDLAIVRSGAPGTACVITEQYSDFNAIDIIIARPNTEKINPVFLCAFTNYPHGKKQIKAGTGGAAQQHFNVGKYKEMTLIKPPMPLQEEFAAFVTQVDKSRTAVQQALDKTQQLFDSLMQQYFA